MDAILSCIAGALSLFGAVGVAVFFKGRKREKIAKIVAFSLFAVVVLTGGFSRFFVSAEQRETLSAVLRCVNVSASTWLLFSLGCAVCAQSQVKGKKFIALSVFGGAVCAVVTVLLVINVFNRFLFDVTDGKTVYEKGYYAVVILQALLWTACAALLIVERKRLCGQDFAMYAILFGIYACGISLNAVFPDFSGCAILGILAITVVLAAECAKREELYQKEKQEAEKLRKDVSLARAQILQSQVSPHFIYNALTAIQAIPNNPYSTKKAIGDFAKYLRQTLTSGNENELIPFEKELENVQVYFRLEKMRFGDDLNIVYDIETTDFEVPIMCVQILAENAVKHGVSVKRGGGTVAVRTARTANGVRITVEDDGVGFDTVKVLDSSHVGISNVKSRVRDLVGGELTIESETGRGTKATIVIPRSDADGSESL